MRHSFYDDYADFGVSYCNLHTDNAVFDFITYQEVGIFEFGVAGYCYMQLLQYFSTCTCM